MRYLGFAYAVAAPVLFAASLPLAVVFFLPAVQPWLLAGLLDLGAGLLLLVAYVYSKSRVSLPANELRGGDVFNFAMALVTGGMIAPVLFMLSLTGTAAESSILLALEAPFTAFFAVILNKERITSVRFISTVLIMASSAVLAGNEFDSKALLAAAAALMFAASHVFTGRIAHLSALQTGAYKMLIAGLVNTTIALSRGEEMPALQMTTWIFVSGFICNGLSYLLYLRGIRELGVMTGGSVFSLVPVFGAGFLLVFSDQPLTARLMMAGALMSAGLLLLLIGRDRPERAPLPGS